MFSNGLVNFLRTLRTSEQKWAFLLCTNSSFRFFQRLGVHVSPIHYYGSIPDVRELLSRDKYWCSRKKLVGIDLRTDAQLKLLKEVIAPYSDECNFPETETGNARDYHTANVYFGYVSAFVMRSFIRHFKPHRVIEIGTGYSTRVIAAALRDNLSEGHDSIFSTVDPFATDDPNKIPNPAKLVSLPAEDLPLSFFESLEYGDLLSIDSTHVLRIGGDVQFLYLEVLPRLKPGVVVHVHDIFFPFEYPREWVVQRRFWTEQYLLQAFLTCNSDFEVIWAQRFMEEAYPDLYSRVFKRTDASENNGSYSFWIRRTSRKIPQ